VRTSWHQRLYRSSSPIENVFSIGSLIYDFEFSPPLCPTKYAVRSGVQYVINGPIRGFSLERQRLFSLRHLSEILLVVLGAERPLRAASKRCDSMNEGMVGKEHTLKGKKSRVREKVGKYNNSLDS
jgi:hypothetical protein